MSTEPSESLKVAELIVGQTYRADFSDCCVMGSFTGELLEIIRDPEDMEIRGDGLQNLNAWQAIRFTTGEATGYDYGGWTFTLAALSGGAS